VVCAALVVGGGLFIGATTAVSYDVFVNQGVGLGGRNQGNFGAVNWGEAGGYGAVGAGLGAVVAPSAAFILSNTTGLATVAGQQGIGSLAFTQAAHAAMWNIGGTLVLDSLAYHGLQQYANTGGVNVDQLVRNESSNPILSTMFLGDMGFSAYEGFQSLGGWRALRAQWQQPAGDPFSGPSRELTMAELDQIVGGSANNGTGAQWRGYQLRDINPDFPPNAKAWATMQGEDFLNFCAWENNDCSEIAEWLFKTADEEGYIVSIEPPGGVKTSSP
jgi:hypothetical protein